MIIDFKFWDEKLQYNIKRETAKISILSSVKIDKREYLIGKEILLSDQKRAIEQTKFVYSPLEKGFEKQNKKLKTKTKNTQKDFKLTENIWLYLLNLLKSILIRTKMVYHLKNKQKIDPLVKENSFEFQDLKENDNPNNLISKYKNESPKELFEDSKDGNVNTGEALKDQTNSEADLVKMNKGNRKK